MPPLIRAERLSKRFGPLQAVDGFSFEVEPGEIYGLLGPNGAGKTTTMRMLGCLLRPSAGQAWVAGASITAEPRRVRASIGMLTEVPGLYLRLTPLEYLDFFAQAYGLAPAAARRARVEEMLRLVGLWDRRAGVMRAFSKGMQQRVAIARTLLHDPPVLFFDEPTAALDPEAAKTIRDHLQHLAESGRRCVLLCTHNLPEAERLCRRLSIVRAGKQIAEGTPAGLKAGVARSVTLRLRRATPELLDRLGRVAGVTELSTNGNGLVSYRTASPEATNPEVVRAAIAARADVLGLGEEEVSLEAVYLARIRAEASQ
jgi:ABC-2 type transport system ATP-binding protein